jgi:hypothetical protein
MWLLPTKSFKSYFTTWRLCSPTPFLLLRFWPFASLMYVISLSLSLSSSCIVQIFPQYTLKFHKYFNNASAATHTIIPKNTGFLSMYYLIGQYLLLYMTMLSSTINCWLDDHILLKCPWTSSSIHLILWSISYVGLVQSMLLCNAFATYKQLVIFSNLSLVIIWDIIGQCKRRFSVDQYRHVEGNFFTSINRQIEKYALNSPKSSGIHSNPLVFAHLCCPQLPMHIY